MNSNSLCNVKLPEYNLGCDGKPIPKEPKPNNRDLQLKELEAATDIPEEKRKLIADEFMRLGKKYPTWKAHKLIRKAGEKYNVKFEFHE
jgi:hypothetical protein